jgi:hypothetical protein
MNRRYESMFPLEHLESYPINIGIEPDKIIACVIDPLTNVNKHMRRILQLFIHKEIYISLQSSYSCKMRYNIRRRYISIEFEFDATSNRTIDDIDRYTIVLSHNVNTIFIKNVYI